ncbi:CLUMA_CG000032, isoform A [Clunio marinus]|uniref:CLUMA_CG000032, isoform A n=1 Tax=Clunio marinus TaxID=568069 RepID=A0A1J1HFX6_9DIPT|nr:CLUMA_CG000032, isoform A [Clunio marinus]
MLRPSSLYRSDSRREPTIEASANNIHKDSIDCGISVLKCCNTPRCQKLANKKTFMIVLGICAILQGAIESYFRISAKKAAMIHNYDPRIVDWLLVASGIFQGTFAIIVAHWGNRLHRTAWLGGLFMLQSILCIIVIIPTIVNNTAENNTIDAIENSVLCIRFASGALQLDNSHGFTTLILLFVLQFGIALGMIAFYTLGFSYLDDNLHEHESPAFLAGALAAKFWGYQFGTLISFLVGLTSLGWFAGWIFLSPILFAIGFIAVLFPKRLLSTVVRQAANSILERATNSSHASLADTKFMADIDFFPTIIRLFTNKILILNILAAVFIQTAFINFSRHETNYLQSRFFLPTTETDGIHREWTSQLITSLLKPPVVALAILVTGFGIAKINPRPRKLVIWNITAASLVAAFFITSIFIECENTTIAGSQRGKILMPLCAQSCFCSSNVPFMPVCPENGVQTYYSPCYAGCGAEIFINNVRMFGNCSCGVDVQMPMTNLMATEGACGMEECQPFWISYQVFSVIIAGLIASTLIGKLIITLRAVLPQDKATAIGVELFALGLIIFIPGKIAYRLIANNFCQYAAPDQFLCFLHESPDYGDWLNIVTASLIGIGVIFEVFLLFSVGDLPLYGDEPEDVYRPIEMENIRRDDNENVTSNTALLSNNNNNNGNESMPIQNVNNGVTYAQILRSNQNPNQTLTSDNNSEQFDFRLQTPSQTRPQMLIHGEGITSGRSSVSSGYIDLTQNMNQRTQRPVARPTSPETSF